LHIDELPQLWNVLRGEMSLIGPRPERPEFLPELEKAIPCYRWRLLVRPGVTGFAQVQLPPDSDLASVRRKLAYDVYYAMHGDLWFDIRILFATALHVVGVPYRVIGTLLDLPSRKATEETYRAMTTMKDSPSHDRVLPDAPPAYAIPLDSDGLPSVLLVEGPCAS
jgi:hypothetical protein